MRKLAFTFILIGLALFSIAQVSKYPPKVIGVFLGEKHPDFNESNFPNVDFYYVIKENYKNPNGMLQGINEGTNLLFDKNGVFVANLNYNGSESSVGQAFNNIKKKKVVTDDNPIEMTPLDDYVTTYIKKGKTMKQGGKLKSKNPEKISDDYISFMLPDFKVTEKDGKEQSFNSLVAGNGMTLVMFMYLDTWNKPQAKTYAEQIEKLTKVNSGI